MENEPDGDNNIEQWSGTEKRVQQHAGSGGHTALN